MYLFLQNEAALDHLLHKRDDRSVAFLPNRWRRLHITANQYMLYFYTIVRQQFLDRHLSNDGAYMDAHVRCHDLPLFNDKLFGAQWDQKLGCL